MKEPIMSKPTNPRRRRAVLAGILVGTAAGVLVAPPASAGEKQLVSYRGLGSHHAAGGGVAVIGSGFGDPFDGDFTAVLSPVDGSLPAAGHCEEATATLRIDGPRRDYVVLGIDDDGGEVCGQWTDSVNRVTHVFTGRYRIVDARHRRLRGTDGWYEIRLADTGVAGVTAVDT
jgi:hypothetical protein